MDCYENFRIIQLPGTMPTTQNKFSKNNFCFHCVGGYFLHMGNGLSNMAKNMFKTQTWVGRKQCCCVPFSQVRENMLLSGNPTQSALCLDMNVRVPTALLHYILHRFYDPAVTCNI